MRPLNITARFIAYLMFFTVVPLLALGIASYRVSYGALKAETERYLLGLVSQQRAYLDLRLQQIEGLVSNVSGVEEITRALEDGGQDEQVDTDLTTQARVGYILNGYLGLEGLVSIDLFAWDGRHFHVGETLDVQRVDAGALARVRAGALAAGRAIWWAGIEDNVNASSRHRKVITAARVLSRIDRHTLEPRPIGLLMVSYDPERLSQDFERASLGNDAQLVVIDGDGRLIHHAQRERVGTPADSALLALAAGRDRLQPGWLDGREVSVDQAISERAGWQVLAVLPLDSLRAQSTPVALATFLITVACLSAAALVAFLYHHSVVRPIREIVERFKQLKAGRLDLSARLAPRGEDEVSELVRGFNALIESLQARQAIEERLRHDAVHDPLTGMPNRAWLVARLDQALQRQRAGADATLAVMFVDLDQFKLINDSLGHGTGDRLLVEVSRRLRQRLRPGDVVARLGGDEFVVLVEQVRDVADATAVADRILQSLAVPFDLQGRQVVVCASVGITLASRGASTPERLLGEADIAMYRAKLLGKARYELFDAAMGERVDARLAVEIDLRGALARGEFRLVYQPIVRIDDATVTGFEALLRWHHPQRGTVSPAEFIPVAEETGTIVEIERWALREACTQLAAWRAALGEARRLTMSVNLSPRQLARRDLAQAVQRTLNDCGVPAEALCLEVTESAIIQDAAGAAAVLEALHAVGVSVHLDDFGTGYSSLSYLSRFPVDAIKIDRSFVQGMHDSTATAGLVRVMVRLAGELGLEVVAEGIETEAQLATLGRLGCSHGQGYLFARPLPPQQAAELLGLGARSGAAQPTAQPAAAPLFVIV